MPFYAFNGVKQGGILSTLLFKLYMDDISNNRNCCQQNCIVNGVPIKHIMSADDVVLLAPFAHALRLFLTSVIPMRLVMTLYIIRKRQLLYHSTVVVQVVDYFHPNGNLYIVPISNSMTP